VFDASGAVLDRAAMMVRDESIGFEVAVQTEDQGRYAVRVPAGSYRVTAQTVQQIWLNGRHFTGFGPMITRTRLPAGQAESSGQFHPAARLTF
jgi:predicted RecB family endonuclease